MTTERPGIVEVREHPTGTETVTTFSDGEIYGRWSPNTGDRVKFSYTPSEGWRVHGKEWQS